MKIGKNLMFAATLIVSILTAAGCGQQQNINQTSSSSDTARQKIIISAAASLKDVMNALADEYKKDHPNVDLTFNLGASGSLQNQIEQGAPADIFISAAQKQMNALADKGLLADNTRQDLLINKIVLVAPKDNSTDLKDFSDITTDKVHKIAIGDPKSVPAGQYAEQIFKNLGYSDAVTPKTVYANDVRAVLAWVENGDADCGLVYKTDAAISDKIKIIAEAPEDSNKPIIYPVAILKSSQNIDAAKSFVDFLQTPAASAIFEKYGFTPAKK
jgi:molybdate transport system substrate-binding protein